MKIVLNPDQTFSMIGTIDQLVALQSAMLFVAEAPLSPSSHSVQHIRLVAEEMMDALLARSWSEAVSKSN